MTNDIDCWAKIVKSLLDCMSEEQVDTNFNYLLSNEFYKKWRENKKKVSTYRFGQHIWNNLQIGGIVSCNELFYEADEEKTTNFLTCFILHAGIQINKRSEI